MGYSISSYKDLERIHDQWEHIDLFGAGRLGKGESYKLLRCEGFVIDGFYDNHLKVRTEVIDGLRIKDINELYTNNESKFIFICMSNKIMDEVEEQLQDHGIHNYACLGSVEFAKILESIDHGPDSVKEKFQEVYDNEQYLKYYFNIKTGKQLDLESPTTFNEKLQWLKLNDKNPRYTELVDKYAFKQHVIEQFGKEYVIPLLGKWDCYDDIDFDSLPEKFVLKCTHDSASIVVVEDKDNLNHRRLKRRFDQCLSFNYYWLSREWPYSNVKRHIIAEEYVSDNGRELKDYKFFCFNGQVKLIQVDFDRFINHKRNIYDIEWNYIPLTIEFPTAPSTIIERPKCLDDMIRVASTLSNGIPHVRVDFYVVNDRPLVGEMTFFHGGGVEKFTPDEWNYTMGEWIKTC